MLKWQSSLAAAAFPGESEFHSCLGPALPVVAPPPQRECVRAADFAPWNPLSSTTPSPGSADLQWDVGKGAVCAASRNVGTPGLGHAPPPRLSVSLRNLLAVASLTRICISQPSSPKVPLGSGRDLNPSLWSLFALGDWQRWLPDGAETLPVFI